MRKIRFSLIFWAPCSFVWVSLSLACNLCFHLVAPGWAAKILTDSKNRKNVHTDLIHPLLHTFGDHDQTNAMRCFPPLNLCISKGYLPRKKLGERERRKNISIEFDVAIGEFETVVWNGKKSQTIGKWSGLKGLCGCIISIERTLKNKVLYMILIIVSNCFRQKL